MAQTGSKMHCRNAVVCAGLRRQSPWRAIFARWDTMRGPTQWRQATCIWGRWQSALASLRSETAAWSIRSLVTGLAWPLSQPHWILPPTGRSPRDRNRPLAIAWAPAITPNRRVLPTPMPNVIFRPVRTPLRRSNEWMIQPHISTRPMWPAFPNAPICLPEPCSAISENLCKKPQRTAIICASRQAHSHFDFHWGR